METNIIRAIINLVNNPVIEVKEFYESRNRANSVGASLEEYVKDLFAGTINETNATIRNKKISEFFSYVGNQNNPPDAMLKGGDAIEVKKIENNDSVLALNSSYPKAKLYANSSMIKKACRDCEKWTEKDMIYIIGIIKGNKLSSLCMVYGNDYAADADVYEQIKYSIKTGIETITDIEFAETNELGRVNRIDPLGITYLRVRGMWGIENPFKVFNYVYKRDINKEFNFMSLISNSKYDTLNYTDDLELLAQQNNSLKIEDVEIKNPNNPAQLRQAKLITYTK